MDSGIAVHENPRVSEGPRQKDGNSDQALVTLPEHHHVCRQGHLGDIKFNVLCHPAEQFGDLYGLKVQVDTLDRHLPGLECAGAVEVDVPAVGEAQLAHVVSCRLEGCRREAEVWVSPTVQRITSFPRARSMVFQDVLVNSSSFPRFVLSA